MGPKKPEKNEPAKEVPNGSDVSSAASENDKISIPSDFDPGYPVRSLTLKLSLKGEPPPGPDLSLLVIFNGKEIFKKRWINGDRIDVISLGVNLFNYEDKTIALDKPVILILRAESKSKDTDPLTHPDNIAGGHIDLLPLLLGEDSVMAKIRLMTSTGEYSGFKLTVHVIASVSDDVSDKIPLLITMISAHCLPPGKNDTVYTAALGLDGLIPTAAVQFGNSNGTSEDEKNMWATASSGGKMFCSLYSLSNADRYIPPNVFLNNTESCVSAYWNAIKRVFVDPVDLRQRLETPFMIEVAGVPKTGKIEVRGRYIGLVDAKVLLQPNSRSVITCASLTHFPENELPENFRPLLDLPPTSAKASAREPLELVDALGHTPYIIIGLDLIDPIVPKLKVAQLFDIIGFPPPEVQVVFDELYVEPPPEDPSVDVRKIREEGGALAVHKELSGLACRGAVPMNQGIKRTAANRLLTRVRTMLKQFTPEDCSYVEWQDTVTAQHAASRRAVTASFRPRPPPEMPLDILAATRCRMAGDDRIADKTLEINLRVLGQHPRVLLSKALRCLEARNDTEAKNYILRAINSQTRNKYLLWLYGGQEFDKGSEAFEKAQTALLIAVKGDYSNGTSGTIGWAALHTVYHFDQNHHAAFVAAEKMRRCYALKQNWKLFYSKWVKTSGEEEVYWVPEALESNDPLLVASAFFLCLRCFKLSEKILQCLELGCAGRGSYTEMETKITPDVYYVRAASFKLRHQFEAALQCIEAGIKRFGPTALLVEMRASCLIETCDWDEHCSAALSEAERYGAKICYTTLLKAAISEMKIDPGGALQRAARVHKVAPCAHSALAIGRIYARKGETKLAERWAAAAVKKEPLLADGWAVLALLAMGKRAVDKARTCLRTARQVGTVSDDIEAQLKKMMRVVKVEELSDTMVKNLCLCEYLRPDEK